jgi:hypothetical protein
MDALRTVMSQVAENMRLAEAAYEAEDIADNIAELWTLIDGDTGVSYGPEPGEEKMMYDALIADGRFDVKILRFPKSGKVRFFLARKE